MRLLRSSNLVLIVILSLCFIFVSGSRVAAITYGPVPTYSITCAGIVQSNAGAQAQWDRNTTGLNGETLRYRVTDGVGTILFAFDDVRVVGSTAGLISFAYTTPPTANPIRLQITSPAGNGFPTQVLVNIVANCATLPLPKTAVAAPVEVPFLWDDRVNHDQGRDVGAPVAIYERDGGIRVYAIDLATSEGHLALSVAADELGDVPAANTLLASGRNPFSGALIELWRLHTGEFQVSTAYAGGKAYVRIWAYGQVEASYDPMPLE